jgi:hypothetical protein
LNSRKSALMRYGLNPRPLGRGARQCYFDVNKSVVADNAFGTPTASGIHFHDILTVPGGVGVIEHVINETGGATSSNTTPVDLVSFP